MARGGRKERRNDMTGRLAVYAGAALVAALAGTWAATLMRSGDDLFAPCRNGQVAGGSIGGPFTLVDETGATVTDADVLAGPSLLYFGYTFCPSICPTDVQRNAFAAEILEDQGRIVTPVFITIDPERDTTDVVAAFTAAFHPRMIGLTGSQDQIDAAKRAWRVLGERDADEGDGLYLMTHTTFTYLTLPGIGFASFYPSETTPEEMAENVACFLDRSATL
jgi:protein SCO1